MNEDRQELAFVNLKRSKAYQTSIIPSDESPGNHDVRSWPRGTVILLISDLLSTAIEENLKEKINDLMMHFNKVSDHLSNMKTTPEQADDRISIEVSKLQKQIDEFYFVSKITLNSKIDTLYKDIRF
jgi:hypothetical protein